jgi:hypothetical protein
MKNIEINIEELVLEGFAPFDKFNVANALERELIRLMNVHGIPTSLTKDNTVSLINAGTFRINQTAGSDSLCGQIANSIYAGLNRLQSR